MSDKERESMGIRATGIVPKRPAVSHRDKLMSDKEREARDFLRWEVTGIGMRADGLVALLHGKGDLAGVQEVIAYTEHSRLMALAEADLVRVTQERDEEKREVKTVEGERDDATRRIHEYLNGGGVPREELVRATQERDEYRRAVENSVGREWAKARGAKLES